jgi:hypothetical protein
VLSLVVLFILMSYRVISGPATVADGVSYYPISLAPLAKPISYNFSLVFGFTA